MASYSPDDDTDSPYEMARKLALAEQGRRAAVPALNPTAPRPPGALRYWLWRMAGRPGKHDELVGFRHLDHQRALTRQRNRVAELARLTEELTRAHDGEVQRLTEAVERAQAEGAALRQRIAELEQEAERSRREHEAELAMVHDGHAAILAKARADAAQARADAINPLQWDLAQARARVAELEAEAAKRAKAPKAITAEELAAALSRATEAEERARLAENKVEMLKDALDAARTRTAQPSAASSDTRFRDAKRAFARAFHPDQGGRDDAEKQRMFLTFWPELERIEREGG